MRILLTNDDSHRSPLLRFVIEKLERLGDLTIVVPKHEQSWKGKSMTRFGYLHLEQARVADREAYTLDGSPADCINLAIHHLFESKPDLIVSGINAGLNTGTAFVLASGTLGACFEANIAGVPAIGFSQAFDSETMSRYVVDYSIADATIDRLDRQTALLLDRIFGIFSKQSGLLDSPITWNVNMPFVAATDTEIRLTRAGHTTYGACFRGEENRFKHDLKDVRKDPDPECDASCLAAGHVSVTPIDVRGLGQIGESERSLWARASGERL